MKKKNKMTNVKYLGNSEIKGYQQYLLVLSFVSIVFLFIIYFINKNSAMLYVIMAALGLVLFVNFVYLRLRLVAFNKEKFFIENVFNKRQIPLDDFVQIQKSMLLPFVFKIKFKGSFFYFLVENKFIFKSLFNPSELEHYYYEKIKL